MINVSAYRTMDKDALLEELVRVVDELCEVIEEEGFVKSSKGNSPERYAISAKRDVLTEHKYLIARLIDAH
jgi:hypothetical protein